MRTRRGGWRRRKNYKCRTHRSKRMRRRRRIRRKLCRCKRRCRKYGRRTSRK